MPVISIEGTRGGFSNAKQDALENAFALAVAGVKEMNLNVGQVTVRMPIDDMAVENPELQDITVRILDVFTHPNRTRKVLASVQYRVMVAAKRHFRKANLIEVPEPVMVNRGGTLTHHRDKNRR